LETLTQQQLIDFETDIANEFNAKKIRAPIHLYSGNEEEMIKIFRKKVRPQDWVLCTWRSHYQCLLKGVPPERLKQDIMAGKSITLCYPEHRIFSSAIVTGILPIAVGLGMAIKHEKKDERVFCFIGDMTAETGAAHECIKYANNWILPVLFVIEDNGKSVCTNTKQTWGYSKEDHMSYEYANPINVYRYKYETKYPHAGSGTRIQF
jgi:pyruvate dehydrogenase E1 component alpha subunit